MTRPYKPQSALNRLSFSPTVNPLLSSFTVKIAGREVTSVPGDRPTIQTSEKKTKSEFDVVFEQGIRAAFSLSLTSFKVWQATRAKHKGSGEGEFVELFWHEGGLAGASIELAEDGYKRGLRELLDKGFLSPRSPGTFWVNPVLFPGTKKIVFATEIVKK